MAKRILSKKQVGRKTKLDKMMKKVICEYLEAGVTVVGICGLAGIGETTYYKWLEWGEGKEKSDIYREFREAIKKAEGKFETRLVKKIELDTSWQSNAWLLERRFPKRWGRIDRRQIEGIEGKPMEFLHIFLPEKERDIPKPKDLT